MLVYGAVKLNRIMAPSAAKRRYEQKRQKGKPRRHLSFALFEGSIGLGYPIPYSGFGKIVKFWDQKERDGRKKKSEKEIA